MLLGNISIAWINSFKYLGVAFNNNGNTINVGCHIIQRKFYSACNSVVSHCRRNNDIVKLHLVKCFCLPLLAYCLGAMVLPHHQVKQLGMCWNIFGALWCSG